MAGMETDANSAIQNALRIIHRGIIVYEMVIDTMELEYSVFLNRLTCVEKDCYVLVSDIFTRSSIFRFCQDLDRFVDRESHESSKLILHPESRSLSLTVHNLYSIQQVLYDFATNSSQFANAISSLKAGLLNRFAISNETSMLVVSPSPLANCDAVASVPGSSISQIIANLILSLVNVLGNISVCGDSLVSKSTLSDILNRAAETINRYMSLDSCRRNLISPIFEFLSGNRTELPPTIDICIWNSTVSSTVPSLRIPNNGASVDFNTNIITVYSFYGNTSISLASPTNCPSTSSPPPAVDCDELSNSQCDLYGGCFVLWGPCQTVSDGFYSPTGSLGQITCPNGIGANEQYIPSSAQIFCQTVCSPRGSVYRATNASCVAIPLGSMVNTCNERVLVDCGFDSMTGIAPISSTTCLGRPIGVAFGSPSPVTDSAPLTIETWIKINTRFVTQDMVIVGVVGYLALGIRYIDERSFSILFYGNQLGGQDVVASGPLPHMNGSEWVHFAFVISADRTGSFFVNGDVVDDLQVDIGPSLPWSSILRTNYTSRLVGLTHIGPIKFLQPDFVLGAIIPKLFLFSNSDMSSLEFQIFNPRVMDKELPPLALGFFGTVPPGYPRPLSQVNTTAILEDIPVRMSWMACRNFCLSNPTSCIDDCGPRQLFNPITCVCEMITTPSAIADSTTFSTVILSSDTSSTTAADISSDSHASSSARTGASIVIILSVLSLIGITIFWLYRRRRVERIGHIKRRSSTDFYDPFNDITTAYFPPH